MKRLGLALAIVISVAALFWSFQERDTQPGVAVSLEDKETAASEDGPNAGLTAADASVDEEERSSLSSATVKNSASQSVRFEGLTGTVVPADGLPLGETVRVQARWYETTDSEKRGPAQSLQVMVESDGSFQIAVSRDADKLELDVLADFLSLAKPLRISRAAEGPLELRPDRGGLLAVDLVGAAALDADAKLGEAFEILASSAGSSNREHRAFVGEDGGLQVGGLPPGNGWWLRFNADLFIDAEVAVAELAKNTVRRVELPIERGVTAVGTVTGPNGAALAGAIVKLYSWKQADARRVNGREEEVEADRDGQFTVGGVIAGEIMLTVLADGMLSHTQSLGEHADGERIEVGAVTMEGGARVTGIVRSADGKPVSKAVVRATQEARSWGAGEETKTDKEGRFEITGLVGETFRVLASKKDRKTKRLLLAEAAALDGVDLALVLEGGLSIRGRVVDDEGSGIEKFTVHAVPLGLNGGASTATVLVKKSEGDFELTGLLPGTWELRATARGYGDGARVRVEVPEGDSDILLSIPRQCLFAGTVVDESGVPVAGAIVNGSGRTSTTGDEGKFSLERVNPGLLELQLAVDGEAVLTRGEWILAPGEQRTGAVVQLRRGGRVLGVVHEGARTGLEFQATLRRDGEFISRTVEVDGEGRFVFDAVSSGDYWAGLSTANETNWVEGHRRARAVPVHVEEGSDAHVVLGDPSDYPIRIFGEVRKEGEVAEGLMVYAYEEEGEPQMPKSLARTDANGEYEIQLRTPGRYIFGVGEGQMRLTRHILDLSDEPEQRIDFELPLGELRGRALLKDGTPVTGRLYTLFYEEADRDSIRAGDFLCAYTQADGTFRFEAVAPGTYFMRAGNYLSGHPTQGTVFVEGIVVPEEGEAPEVEVTIPEGAVIDVVAEDGSGNALPGCRIKLTTEIGHPSQLFDDRKTDYAGTLRYTGVGPGTWIATVMSAAGKVIGRQNLSVAEGEISRSIVVCTP